jgi:predicted enzyme related to lactoylglutathione lyase
MGFMVADIDAEVRDLKQRGAQFEEYDFPGFDKATGIADVGGTRAAWFKDSEGNLLGLVEQS